jgi:hypothetical protein
MTTLIKDPILHTTLTVKVLVLAKPVPRQFEVVVEESLVLFVLF